MRQFPAYPVHDAGHNIIGFVRATPSGFEPSLRARIIVTFPGQACGNKHTLLRSCSSLPLAVEDIKRAARHK